MNNIRLTNGEETFLLGSVIEDEIAKSKQRGAGADVVEGLRTLVARVYALRSE